MSRGFGAMQRAILRTMEASQHYEPRGPHEPHLYFADAQGREYHPAQVVRLGWLSAAVAVQRGALGPWELPSGRISVAQSETFKAPFSRALRGLLARQVMVPVRHPSLLVLAAAAECRGRPQACYRRRPSDRYIARNPDVSVNSFWVTT